MYFNSQFFPQMGGMMPAHPGMQNSMHSMNMNMLYMDSLSRQEQCSSGMLHTDRQTDRQRQLRGENIIGRYKLTDTSRQRQLRRKSKRQNQKEKKTEAIKKRKTG